MEARHTICEEVAEAAREVMENPGWFIRLSSAIDDYDKATHGQRDEGPPMRSPDRDEKLRVVALQAAAATFAAVPGRAHAPSPERAVLVWAGLFADWLRTAPDEPAQPEEG